MAERKILNGWKEIAAHIGRSIRTVQRWEFTLQMPVHRPSHKKRSAVLGFSDELEAWLNRADVGSAPYVRPILLVLDKPEPNSLSDRKLALEMEKFNVLTAFTLGEMFATADTTTFHGIVLNCAAAESPNTLCRLIKQQFPRTPLFAIAPNGLQPDCADHVIRSDDAHELVKQVIAVFGKPRLI